MRRGISGGREGDEFREGRKPGPEHARCRKRRVRLEGGECRDIDDDPGLLFLHDRRDETSRSNCIQEVALHYLDIEPSISSTIFKHCKDDRPRNVAYVSSRLKFSPHSSFKMFANTVLARRSLSKRTPSQSKIMRSKYCTEVTCQPGTNNCAKLLPINEGDCKQLLRYAGLLA